jgi:predicted transposase YbfD/YdcC
LSLLHPAAFQTCFSAWLSVLKEQAAAASEIEQPIYAVDGKTARRSHDRKRGLGALHSVSVWASELGLSLGQVACEDKSNEITAIPELLKLVDLQGAIITIDAMGTQKAIAEQIINQNADYVLALKGNQEKLHDAVIQYIDQQFDNNFAGIDARQHTTKETAHGRDETRCYVHLPIPEALPNQDQWQGLKSIGVVISACVRNDKEMIERRYYISSLPVGVKCFARAVRGHWGIENSCHWSLDMTFREDESRIRDRNLRENFAWLNRFLLSLLKQHPSKNSVVGKRRSCAWNDDFLLQVLTGAST